MKNLNCSKKTVAIIFGGCSPEYGVSLESSSSVIRNIDREKYDVILIGITKNGDWYKFDGSVEKIENDTWFNVKDCVPAMISPNRTEKSLIIFDSGTVKKIRIDAAFPVLHGKNGEDGTVQGVLEIAGIPIAGCGVMASALCMDKDRAHRIAKCAGVEVPKSFAYGESAKLDDILQDADSIGYPLFVKPVKAGSSYGITKVNSAEEMEKAIELAFEYDDQIVVEENISGFEVGCAVFGKDELIVGEVDEIELSDGFFNFTEKYTLKTSAIYVPARISPKKSAEVKEIAKIIYKALGCGIFARVDMFITDSGRIVFNEVNTIPGFTAHSRYPSMLKAIGMSFADVISGAIELAVGH